MQKLLTAALLCSANAAYAIDCDFWGEFAAVAHGDYTTRVEVGTDDPIGETSELLQVAYYDPGSMGHTYRSGIIDALERGESEEALYNIGRDICLSYPEGTFDPDGLD